MASHFEQFGKYLLLEKLATGGMAEVFLSRQTGAEGIGKFCAIKRILPQFAESQDFIDMFREEAKIAINLNHSNVVSIHEFGVEKDQFFLVMDYVEGRNLRQILNKMKKSAAKFSVEQIVFIIKEVASGLEHAHRCIDGTTGKPLNITHRDMSPQNVMVSFEGEVKIVDFGIAKAETQSETTRAGTLKGKFGYMSPEQAEGQTVDLRTDVFSLGIVLWELLANDRLFIANNEINTLRKIRECQVPLLRKINPNIHPELERITKKALTRDRNLRYQTSGALHRDLNRFLNRQYPDFSHQDFSVFIRTLFNEELLTTRKRLIEYAQVPSVQQDRGRSSSEVQQEVPQLQFKELAPAKNSKDHTLTSSFVSTSGLQNEESTQKTLLMPDSEKKSEDPSQVSFVLEENSQSSIDAAALPESNEKFRRYSKKEVEQIQATQVSKIENIDDETPNFINVNSINQQLDDLKKDTQNKASQQIKTESFKDDEDTLSRRVRYQRKEVISIQKSSTLSSFFFLFIAVIAVYSVFAKVMTQEMQPIITQLDPYFGPLHRMLGVTSSITLSSSENLGAQETPQGEEARNDVQLPIPAAPPASTIEQASLPPPAELDKGAEETSPALLLGGVIVVSDPSGAEIFVDGLNTQNLTPAMVQVPIGQNFRLDLRKSGYVDYYQENLKIKQAGERVAATLQKALVAHINIDVKPTTNVRLFLNERKLGESQLPIIGYAIPANIPITIKAKHLPSGREKTMTFELPPNARKAIVLDLRQKRKPANK